MHTPTPWTKGKHGDMRAPDGRQVTTYGLNIAAVMSSPSDEDRANSEFIIKAVNSYDEMVRLLNAVLDEDYSSTTLWCEIAGMLKKLGEEP